MADKKDSDFSEKLKRYFVWGGPKKEVTNFDMALTIAIVLAVLVIAVVLFY